MIPLARLAWILLHVSASLALALETGLAATPRPPELERLPEHLPGLDLLEEIPFDPQTLGEDPPERHAFRRVRDAAGNEGRLFIAYYERAQRWSGRPHDVGRCFVAQGWRERESHRLAEAHRPWSRLFERGEGSENGRVRVIHWLERPGPDQDRIAWSELGARIASGRGLRPDVASVYLEFDAERAPADGEAAAIVATLSAALEELW